MAHPAGETNDKVVRLGFDHRLMLRFCAWGWNYKSMA